MASRLGIQARHASACQLSVQARAGAGCRLRHAVARDAARAACPHRRHPRAPIRRSCREPAGVAGAPLHRGRIDRESRGLVGQGRDSGRSRARRLSKPPSSLREPFPKSPSYRPRLSCAARRSSASRAHQSAVQRQRICRAGDHGGSGAGAPIDREAEALGEPPEDPLLLFAVLFGFWVANYVAFNGDVMRELAAQFLAIAEKQGASVPLMMGHQLMGISLASTGDFVGARAHHDQALARYDPVAHRSLGPRFSVAPRVQILCFRSFALWMLGYPEAALADASQGLQACARGRRRGQLDVCAVLGAGHACVVRSLRCRQRAARRTARFCRARKARCSGRRTACRCAARFWRSAATRRRRRK